MKKIKFIIGVVIVLLCVASISGIVCYASVKPDVPANTSSDELQTTYAVVMDSEDGETVITVTYDKAIAEKIKEINSTDESVCKVEKLNFAFDSSAMEKAKNIIEC